MSTVRVSVIIPLSKLDVVEATLDLLVQQTYPGESTEILVVGARSGQLAGRWPITAVETAPLYFPGQARNLGAAAATGEYLLFIDDDCEPAPDWIEQNVAALHQPGVGAVGGQIAGKSKAFFAQCVDFSSFAFYQSSQPRETHVCSASLGVRRQVFEDVGGFNAQLRSGEDIDFCYRLMGMGYKTVYQPAVKVRHNHGRTDFMTLMRYSYFYGRVKGLFVKVRHQRMSRRNRALAMLRRPLPYFAMIIPISLSITALIIRVNVREYPRVLLYAPFVFLAKVAYHVGIWQCLRKGTPTFDTAGPKRERPPAQVLSNPQGRRAAHL